MTRPDIASGLPPFTNVCPFQKEDILWGWKNETAPGQVYPTVVEPLGKIRMPNLVECFAWEALRLERFKHDQPYGTVDFKSIFQTASRFMGFFALLETLPDLSPITEGFLAWNEKLLRTFRNFTYFIIGDDIAWKGGLFLSPKQMHDWYLPHLLTLANLGSRYALKVIFHSDGDIWDFLPYLTGMVWGLSFEPVGHMKHIQVSDGFALFPTSWSADLKETSS